MTKHALFASLLFPALSQGAGLLIDVNFPDGTGTNATFQEIDNGVGDNTWTQATGVLSSAASNNSSIGAASDLAVDFSTLAGEALVLDVNVSSVSGTLIANGMFVGFQRRVNGGTGADLWNNLATSFGMVIPGSANVANGVRHVGIGGNAGTGRYQAFDYGIASAASIQDGFDVTLTIDSNGWDLDIAGLEADDATPITGGSGTWGSDGISAFADFNDDMRVGSSFQTTAAAGDLTFSQITLNQVAVPEPSSIALAGIAALGLLRRRR